MSKKRDAKTDVSAASALLAEEARELEMILDRLSVQDPEGESLGSYLESLRSALTGRENMVAALIERLSRKPTEVGFHAYLKLQELIESKKYARASRQAGYRFAQQGFSKPAEAEIERKIVLIPRESRESVAHMAPVGEAFWFLSALIHEADYLEPTAISAHVEEVSNRVSVKVVETTHKAYREYTQKLYQHLPRKPLEIPLWHAARLFNEMLEFFGTDGVAASAEVERARKHFQPFYDPERPPYVFELMPVLEHPERQLHEVDLKALLESIAVQWLTFPKNDMQPFWERLHELESSVLVISPEIQQERSLELIKRAADELCVGKLRLLYMRFFEEEAMWLKLSGRGRLAMSAWIVAQHLLSGAQASENPLVSNMVVVSMRHYWPDEFKTKDREADHFRQTESGIIIPR